MSKFPQTHGLKLIKNSWIENLNVEELDFDPDISELINKPRRIWFNKTDNKLKASFRDPSDPNNNVVIRELLTLANIKNNFIDLDDTPEDYLLNHYLVSTEDSIILKEIPFKYYQPNVRLASTSMTLQNASLLVPGYTDPTGNITYTATSPGESGNNITVEHIKLNNNPNQSLDINVTIDAVNDISHISVTLPTDLNDNIDITAKDLSIALNNNPDVNNLVTTSVIDPAPSNWLDYTGPTLWDSSNTWTGTEWESDPTENSISLKVKIDQHWHEGFRPTKMRVTFSGIPTIDNILLLNKNSYCFYGEYHFILDADNVSSLQELDLDWSDNVDMIAYGYYHCQTLIFSSNQPFSISKIEFYDGNNGKPGIIDETHLSGGHGTLVTPDTVNPIDFDNGHILSVDDIIFLKDCGNNNGLYRVLDTNLPFCTVEKLEHKHGLFFFVSEGTYKGYGFVQLSHNNDPPPIDFFQFNNLSGSSSSETFIDLIDTPSSYGNPGEIIVVNDSGDGFKFSDIQLQKFEYSSTNPLLIHNITHNLNTLYPSVDIWVQNQTGEWSNEICKISILDENNIKIELSRESNIRVKIT